MHWKGKDGYEYPWGTQNDFESLTYEGDDAHPETCTVRGEAESVFALKGRTLVWRGHLLVTTDQKNFYYKYTRELLKDGQMFEDEDVAGDDSAGPSVDDAAETSPSEQLHSSTCAPELSSATCSSDRPPATGGTIALRLRGERRGGRRHRRAISGRAAHLRRYRDLHPARDCRHSPTRCCRRGAASLTSLK